MRRRSGKPLLLSAILCTRNRADLLRRALGSLCRQTLDRARYEIVVVDDGSEDDTRAVTRTFESQAQVRYSHQGRAGLASAKNHGVFFAKGRIVLFLNDDEVADVRLLEVHGRAQERVHKQPSAIVGMARADRSLAGDPLVRLACPAAACTDGDGSLGLTRLVHAPTSFPRAFLLVQSVFDPVLGMGLENADLALRLVRKGLRLVSAPKALTTRTWCPPLDELLERAYEEGRYCFELNRLHPEPAVQTWTGVTHALEAWPEMERTCAEVIGAARALYRDVRARLDAGAPVADPERDALARGTAAALRTMKTKGIADRANDRAK